MERRSFFDFTLNVFSPSFSSDHFVRPAEDFLKALRISKECLHWVDLGLSKDLHFTWSIRKNLIFERIALKSHFGHMCILFYSTTTYMLTGNVSFR